MAGRSSGDSSVVALPPQVPHRRLTWGAGPCSALKRCITLVDLRPLPRGSGGTRVNFLKIKHLQPGLNPDVTAPSIGQAAVRQMVVDEAGAGQRLDNFLIRHLKGVPKTHIYRVIRSGEVRVNKGRAQADTRLVDGDVVRIPPVRTAQPDTAAGAKPVAPAREFPVLFEDDWVLAIAKPAGVAVHGGSGVSHGVIEQLRQARPQARFLELVHRLDKETSGALLLAKKRSALTHLQDQFRQRGEGSVHKVYAALVWGDWPARLKVIDLALHKTLDAAGERHVRVVPEDHPDGRRSISLVRVAGRFAAPSDPTVGTLSLVDVTLKTGRTHQIRVHLSHHGHAIVGDPKYGDFNRNRTIARGPLRFDRMFLHARELGFLHPASGERILLNAPLPPECVTLLGCLNATPT